MNNSDASAPAGVPDGLRRLKWNELVTRGGFVVAEPRGFELWDGPAGFQANSFLTRVYRQSGTHMRLMRSVH